MPDQSGNLTQDERDRFMEYLNRIWRGSKACPVSGHNTWAIAEHITHEPQWTQGGIVFGGPTYPAINVTCTGCGYMMSFNAVVAGFVQGAAGGPEGGDGK